MSEAQPDSGRISFQADNQQTRRMRSRLTVQGELLLALLPTLVVLLVLVFVEIFSRQRLLFASLASSAFLIYLDPEHGTNTVRNLIVSHVIASLAGVLTYIGLGAGYLAGGSAMVVTIVMMIVLDAVHPPAVSTALSFAFREGSARTLTLFLLSLSLIAALVLLQRSAVWILVRLHAAGSRYLQPEAAHEDT